jgi:hypothetical protein
MTATSRRTRALTVVAGSLGVAAAVYAAWVATSWISYGRVALPSNDEADAHLDRFMPDYEIVERHQVHVAAPPEITLQAAAEADLQQSRLVRAIFTAREWLLGAEPADIPRHPGLIADMRALGWQVLADSPGREIVMGAVTQPWLARVEFRGVPPGAFRAFSEPGYVKIVWTLRADPTGAGHSIFRTETRATTTDAAARARFRWYWARFSPGIVLIRRFLIRDLKLDAERRARQHESMVNL